MSYVDYHPPLVHVTVHWQAWLVAKQMHLEREISKKNLVKGWLAILVEHNFVISLKIEQSPTLSTHQ